MSQGRPLQTLVSLLLRDALPRMAEAFQRRNAAVADLLAGSDALFVEPSENLGSLADEILRELGPKTPLRDARDILQVVGEEFAATLSNASTGDDFSVALNAATKRLRDPIRPFRFRVPISASSVASLQMELGGSDALQIRDCSSQGEQPRMELLGCIEAPHAHYAVGRVERHIKTLAGTCIATDLARYYYVRIRQVPAVAIEGIPDEFQVDAGVGALAAGLVFGVPEDLDEISARRAKAVGITEAFSTTLERVAYVIASPDGRAITLRSAAVLFGEAVAATDAGRSVAFALMALEATLLERSSSDNVLARLKEAVAYRLGGSPDARGELRKTLSRLYEVRSSFVHRGEIHAPESERRAGLEIVHMVLKREIGGLDLGSKS